MNLIVVFGESSSRKGMQLNSENLLMQVICNLLKASPGRDIMWVDNHKKQA
jgi:hypothetical protein